MTWGRIERQFDPETVMAGCVTDSAGPPSRRDVVIVAQRFIAGNRVIPANQSPVSMKRLSVVKGRFAFLRRLRLASGPFPEGIEAEG